MADEQPRLTLPGTAPGEADGAGSEAGLPAGPGQASGEPVPAGGGQPASDRPLDPEKLLRLAGLVRAVLDEVRQMDPDEATASELADLHGRVTDQISEGLPNMLRRELEAIDLALPFQDGATGQEVRLAYAGLIGWLSGLFQGLQAAVQYQQMQGQAALQRGLGEPSMMESGPHHATGQYL